MKNIKAVVWTLIVFVAFLIAMPIITYAQATDVTPVTSLFDNIDLIYSAIVLIGGYLSAKIPFLNKIDNATYRVLAWAILTGLGFMYFGSSVWTVAISYFMSTSLYEVILKQIIKSPKITK